MQNASLQRYQAVIASPVPGAPRIGVVSSDNGIERIEFLRQHQACFVTAEGREAAEALQAYLFQAKHPASLSVAPHGTAFQQRVWHVLQAIPVGEVRRYGEVAAELDSSARAVAAACRANPVPLLIPCHRVVAANGPGGYLGETEGEALAIKLWLLQHEGYV